VQNRVSHLIANADGSAPLELHERLLTEAARGWRPSPRAACGCLSSIYRKLGIRSRTELAGIVAGLSL
jgi:hypothetical protein